MNKSCSVIIVGSSAEVLAKRTRELVEEANGDVLIIVASDLVPVPQAPEPIVHQLVDTRLNDDFYLPKAKHQRKSWQRPYKYHP